MLFYYNPTHDNIFLNFVLGSNKKFLCSRVGKSANLFSSKGDPLTPYVIKGCDVTSLQQGDRKKNWQRL